MIYSNLIIIHNKLFGNIKFNTEYSSKVYDKNHFNKIYQLFGKITIMVKNIFVLPDSQLFPFICLSK